MKKLALFPCIFFSVPLFLQAMDQKEQTSLCTIAWAKNRIFIGDNSRCCRFSATDSKDKKIVCNNPTDHIVVNAHQTVVALSNATLLELYDTTTLKKIWSKETITQNRSAPFFGRKETIGIFNHNELTIYNYAPDNNSVYYKIPNLPIPSSPLMSYCWQMEELAYVYDTCEVALFHPIFPLIVKNCKRKHGSYEPAISCEYCPNGSLLAVNEINKCHIYDLRPSHQSYHLQAKYKYSIQSLAFHPDRPILAVLVTRFNRIGNLLFNYRDIIQYWNPVRRTLLMHTSPLHYPHVLSITGGKTRRLAFSPDGNKLAVSTNNSNNSYHVVDVPANPSFFVCFALKQKNMPHELISKIITYMFTLSRRFFELSCT